MISHEGPELDPGSPEYRWVASIIRSVERRTGRASRWNGRIYEETDPRFVGSAGVDGSMTVSEPDVLAPARLAYTSDRLTYEDSVRARDAVATVTHEAGHLVSRNGDPEAPGAHPTSDQPSVALDEGLTEIWTHRNLDDVVRDIGMDRLVGQQTLDAYPACTSATNGLLDGMATITGRPRAEIARHLVTADLAQRWNTIADMAITRHLSGLIPADDHHSVRQDLANTLRADFARAHEVQSSPDLDDTAKAHQGWHTGHHAATNLDLEITRLQHHYRTHPTAAHPDTTHPDTTQPVPSQPAPGHRPALMTTHEIAHLQAFLTTQPPPTCALTTHPQQATIRPPHLQTARQTARNGPPDRSRGSS